MQENEARNSAKPERHLPRLMALSVGLPLQVQFIQTLKTPKIS